MNVSPALVNAIRTALDPHFATDEALDDAVATLVTDIDALQTDVGAIQSAWTAWTSTITASGGTFTSVAGAGRYKHTGKTFMFSLEIVITTNGTAATSLNATLPAGITAAALRFSVNGFSNSTGLALKGAVQAGATSITSISNYDNTYPGASGRTLVVSGAFETT